MLGRRGGPHILRLPWVRKPSELIAVRPALVELAADGKSLRVGERAQLRVSRRADENRAFDCGIIDCTRVAARVLERRDRRESRSRPAYTTKRLRRRE